MKNEQEQHRILVVEDEEDLLCGLEINLAREGYRVFKAFAGAEALAIAVKENPDLILLDLMLPGMGGMDVCREIRRKGLEVPIIMLTAKATEVDKVLGLEIGADDYVTKPFSLHELLARIRVQLRHRRPHSDHALTRYRFGRVEVNFERCTCMHAGQEVEMTAKEYDVLRMLIGNRGTVVTRERLLNEVWGYENYPTTRTVDNHVLRLRQKLEEDPANPKFILSVYGEGYKFVG